MQTSLRATPVRIGSTNRNKGTNCMPSILCRSIDDQVDKQRFSTMNWPQIKSSGSDGYGACTSSSRTFCLSSYQICRARLLSMALKRMTANVFKHLIDHMCPWVFGFFVQRKYNSGIWILKLPIAAARDMPQATQATPIACKYAPVCCSLHWAIPSMRLGNPGCRWSTTTPAATMTLMTTNLTSTNACSAAGAPTSITPPYTAH